MNEAERKARLEEVLELEARLREGGVPHYKELIEEYVATLDLATRKELDDLRAMREASK